MTGRNPQQTEPSIGLALGGGGARGFAHLKVIEAFDDLGLRPCAIAGTSIGALIGVAYASGISAHEAIERTQGLIGGRRQAIRHLFASRPTSLSGLLSLTGSKGAILNAQPIVETVLPELTGRNFDTLGIPSTVTATDFHARSAMAFDSDEIVPALAASMALPGLFSPVEIDGRFHVDGGLTNPLPYDHVHKRCDITIAIDVTGGPVGDATHRPSMMDALMGSVQIMLGALVAARVDALPPDILIKPPVDSFRILDLFSFDEILAASQPVKETLKRKIDRAFSAYAQKKTGA
ncbi:MAG: patatin-like phospholipase family protein [Rhizobiales bacterium]|nr:patatin-like phospholipase family protein [Hyphomicrobiales bacterium]